jgi:hypothetical protein
MDQYVQFDMQEGFFDLTANCLMFDKVETRELLKMCDFSQKVQNLRVSDIIYKFELPIYIQNKLYEFYLNNKDKS